MIYDTKRFQEIMDNLGLTPNQIYFCVLLLEQDAKRKRELFNNYTKKHGGFELEDIKKLEEKGYIEDFSNSKVDKTVIKTIGRGQAIVKKLQEFTILELIMVTPKFKDSIYIDAEIATEEFLKAYPSWITIKDKSTGKSTRFPIKKITDMTQFVNFYQTIINGDIIKHKLIVEMASHYKKFVDKGVVAGVNVKTALESKFWLQIEELIELEEAEREGSISSL